MNNKMNGPAPFRKRALTLELAMFPLPFSKAKVTLARVIKYRAWEIDQ